MYNKEYHKKYYQKNKDKLTKIQREYRAKNKEKIKEARKKYNERNKDKKLEWFQKNDEKWGQWRRENHCWYCIICGYNVFLPAVDFHHFERNRNNIKMGVFMKQRACNKENKMIMKQELKKGISICRTCHQELEYMKVLYW